ncbi:hypothetical protein [Candidatus Pseudoruminococcus sp.]|uniref:hypothetical protein n=1 Tax=Candidatus Pseudoruminococcus sp. TaxID=3101048 RepID=UPI00399A4540
MYNININLVMLIIFVIIALPSLVVLLLLYNKEVYKNYYKNKKIAIKIIKSCKNIHTFYELKTLLPYSSGLTYEDIFDINFNIVSDIEDDTEIIITLYFSDSIIIEKLTEKLIEPDLVNLKIGSINKL